MQKTLLGVEFAQDGTQFTWFTGTKVQILTQRALLGVEFAQDGNLKDILVPYQSAAELKTANWGVYICVLNLLYVCPATTIYVSSYSSPIPICSRAEDSKLGGIYMCPHPSIYVSSYHYICVLILLYVCARTPLSSGPILYMCPHTTVYVSSSFYMCVLIPLYMCPHPSICVCARTPLYSGPIPIGSRADDGWGVYLIAIYVSSYHYICALIQLYMCPHTATYVSSYCYMCPHTAICVSVYYYYICT
jgi:hypothetical protein